MNKVRLKQKRLFKIMKALVIIGAIFFFVYIGVKPYIESMNTTLGLILNYFADALVVIILIFLFMYYSKYGKCASYLSSIEDEINDYGYYLTSREEKNTDEYIKAMTDDLSCCGYSINTKYESNELTFDVKASKKKEFFYIVNVDDADRNDVLAYLDVVIQDITIKNLKKRGDAVICFITNKADDSAISLSKMITPIGKKEQLKIAIAICEPSSGNVYFLGNDDSKNKRMIANFVMNCEVPIKDKFIHKDKLQFQYDIENKMEEFTIKAFEKGEFTVH